MIGVILGPVIVLSMVLLVLLILIHAYNRKYLITYYFRRKNGSSFDTSFHHDIVRDPMEWLESVQKYTDSKYILISVFPISSKWAKKFNGVF